MGFCLSYSPGNRWHPKTLSAPESLFSSVGHQHAGLQRHRGPLLPELPLPAPFSAQPVEMPRASSSCNIFGVSSSFPALRQEMRKCTVRKTEKLASNIFPTEGSRLESGSSRDTEECPSVRPPDVAGVLEHGAGCRGAGHLWAEQEGESQGNACLPAFP